MKLAILGGGGVRMPALVHALLSGAGSPIFDEIGLFEPDPMRQATTARLARELAAELGYAGIVQIVDEVEAAFRGADFVFSAIRVGGDAGRVIDEDVALRRGVVGQETTGPGGAAMALRTIPVVLEYCAMLERIAPRAVLINFTNPAGIITQAIASHTKIRAVGVCDTPSSAIDRLAAFLGAEGLPRSYRYGGLNHLGWISSLVLDGEEHMEELLARYEELQRFDRRFAGLDAAMVRRARAIPTEYVLYYYDPSRYVDAVRRAGSSRGQDVAKLNEELLMGIARAFERGGVQEAWATYSMLLNLRHDTYLRIEVEGERAKRAARTWPSAEGASPIADRRPGGYEAIALAVIEGLTRGAREVIVNLPNAKTLWFLEPDDVVEVPALVHQGGLAPLAIGELSRPVRSLIAEVKEYERAVVEAAVDQSAELAALALALNPLVPGVSVAKEMMQEYRERHGKHLAYLH